MGGSSQSSWSMTSRKYSEPGPFANRNVKFHTVCSRPSPHKEVPQGLRYRYRRSHARNFPTCRSAIPRLHGGRPLSLQSSRATRSKPIATKKGDGTLRGLPSKSPTSTNLPDCPHTTSGNPHWNALVQSRDGSKRAATKNVHSKW